MGSLPNTYKIDWPIPDKKPLVSLIIPTKDKLNLLKSAIHSIKSKTTYDNYEILIVDNDSVEEGTQNYFNEIIKNKNIKIISYNKEFNYSAINNYAVTFAKGDIIGLLNNDIEVINSEWLTEMVMHVIRPGIGCVGAKLFYSTNQIQHAGVIIGLGGVAGHSHKYCWGNDSGYYGRLKLVQNVSAVTGACLLVKKNIYHEVGGLDEKNLAVAFNDVDFCLKVLTAGYRNLWTPYARLLHHESKSRGHDDFGEKKKRFNKEVLYMQKKWGTDKYIDPYYSPNLTQEKEDFSLNLK
jgi:GT2 family glycosyltransferase